MTMLELVWIDLFSFDRFFPRICTFPLLTLPVILLPC